MELHDGEPEAGPWRVVAIRDLIASLLDDVAADRPAIVAVDGRSSNGKTTLAARIAAAVPGTTVVHTDDVAWHHSIFGWVDLLVEGVLLPVRRGEPVSFRPPAWDQRERDGAIVVPVGARILVVEGVGAARREVEPLVDAVIWVQSDRAETERRDAERIRTGETTPSVYAAWMGEEVPFQADQRPWERAHVVVAGTTDISHDPPAEVVIADPPR